MARHLPLVTDTAPRVPAPRAPREGDRPFPPTELRSQPVRRLTDPPQRLLDAFARAGEPVIVRGALTSWRAVGTWSPEALRDRMGALELPVYVVPQGRILIDDETGFRIERMTVARYVDHVLSGEPPRWYLRGALDALPSELRAELGVPNWCEGAPRLRQNLWFSADGTVSRLHFDLPHNLIAQLWGKKRFLLFPAAERRHLYPFPLFSAVPHLSQVDLEAPDLRSFPKLAEARAFHCVLEPGDLLFMPSRMWHHARSLGPSISVNSWWPPLTILPLSVASDLYKRARGLKI
jgi:hypothetical protein